MEQRKWNKRHCYVIVLFDMSCMSVKRFTLYMFDHHQRLTTFFNWGVQVLIVDTTLHYLATFQKKIHDRAPQMQPTEVFYEKRSEIFPKILQYSQESPCVGVSSVFFLRIYLEQLLCREPVNVWYCKEELHSTHYFRNFRNFKNTKC